ncbi:MAG TPA: hypothetical protein DHV62_03235, partial [Elusimicrobia bacterium]|nr:hypothetical protein [Elusimicrobiota bacterium]
MKKEIVELETNLAKTHPKVEELVSRLEKSIKAKDTVVRKQVIDEIRAISPAMKNFLDLFLIAETGKIDDYQLSALKTRLLKEFAPEKVSKRVAIVGSNVVSRQLAREIVSKSYDDVELVTLIGKPI